jgi:hypothetical protein
LAGFEGSREVMWKTLRQDTLGGLPLAVLRAA